MTSNYHILKCCSYLFIIFFFIEKARSQVCSPDYFFKRYNGNTAVYNYKVITTPQNDILNAGATLKINGDFADATDGWITKLSARGVVLWSKRYFIGGYNSGGFLSIENATDSTYLITGRFGKYVRVNNGQVQEIDAATILAHLDKFGNIIWVKRITNYINDSHLSSITKLRDNSFLLSGSVINSQGVKLLLLKTDLNGNVSWHKLMFVENTQVGAGAVKELNNGELLLSGITFTPGPNYSYFSKQGYYFIKLDAGTGSVTRSSAIYFNENESPIINSFDNVQKIIELPGDTLILATSFSERLTYSLDPGVREAVLIKTGMNGQFYNATAYYNSQPGCQLSDIRLFNNQFDLLLDDGFKSLYTTVNRAGEIANQKAYGNVFSLLRGFKIAEGSPDGRIIFSGRRQFALFGLMKTENNGSISCMETTSQMVNKDVSPLFTTADFTLSFVSTSFPFAFEDIGRSLGWANYTFNMTTDCAVVCCNNIRSDTTQTELCNAIQYKLPDNSIVKESGLYYTSHKTANNCDSIAYYALKFSTKPIVNLGTDTCFGNSRTITLQTDSGYVNYSWMGINTSSHQYDISSPGIYSVYVTNRCGTSSDAIEVFDECDFPVYMPSAFTPNSDGLNDQFLFPALSRQKFLSMSVYNRYGQLIFFSTDRSKGWNGDYKNSIQPSGVYVYTLRLKSLDGKPIFKKGTVLLAR